MMSVITNIDKDHIKTYGSYNKLVKTFLDFASNLPFYGVCIVCKDDPGVIKILDKINRPLISYGLNDKSDVRAINISQNKRRIIFKVIHNKYNKSFLVNLNLIGKHNVLNTLAAISVAFELGIKIDTIKKSLKTFAGVARRLEYCGLLNIDNKNVLLFDDYGHHPNEIKEVLKSLKNSYQDKRLIVIFQLHRYSRTQDLFDDFVNILSTIDNLILLNIYSAGENKIPGISSKTIANAIFKKSNLKPILVKNLNQALKELNSIVKNNDVVLTLGAGNISALVDLFIEKYAN
jgi:UDP-N-acetylmuramate--alanine ligase